MYSPVFLPHVLDLLVEPPAPPAKGEPDLSRALRAAFSCCVQESMVPAVSLAEALVVFEFHAGYQYFMMKWVAAYTPPTQRVAAEIMLNVANSLANSFIVPPFESEFSE